MPHVLHDSNRQPPSPPTPHTEQLNALEDKLDDANERLVRIETRLVKLMLDHGLTARGEVQS